MIAPRGPSLRIVSVNDVYSLENLPRLATLIRHYALCCAGERFIAVLAGDFVAPSMLSSLDAGRGMIECLNAAGITHVILGNHEDDISTEELRSRIDEFRGVWLSTNVTGLHPALVPSVRYRLPRSDGGEVHVALVGVVMSDAAVYRGAPFGGAKMEPANATVMREAASLNERAFTTVIPITHQSMSDDRALAREPGGFPVIVGGHEHDVHIEQVNGTWIVKAGIDAAQAIIVDLTWSAVAPTAGTPDLPTVAVRIEPVSDYAEDSGLRALVDHHMARVTELENAVLISLAEGEVLSSVGSRVQQTSFGTLVCSRTRDALGADACLLNGGGIRVGREYRRHVAYGDIEAELPFDNEMVVVKLPGSVLRDAVERSRAHAPAESGGFLQVDDRMIVAPSGDVTHVKGLPLDPTRTYSVALVRSFLSGMDHIEPLVRFGSEHPERVPPAGSGRELKHVLVDALSLSLFRRLGSFDSIDENHDGKLSEVEVSHAVARTTGEPASPITVALAMGAVDKGHVHEVTREEVARALDPPLEPPAS